MSVVPVLPSDDPAPATRFTTADGLQISPSLDAFIKSSLPASISPENFYFCLNDLVVNIEPRIRTALKTRDEIQSQIDDYHRKNPGPIDAAKYEAFLQSINYLFPVPESVTVSTSGVDEEIATIPGPQLVVPVNNARFALNAANARWGSLYSCLYGTDVFGPPIKGPYDASRGSQVTSWVRKWLDDVLPLEEESHAQVTSYECEGGEMKPKMKQGKFLGTRETTTAKHFLLENNGLKIEIVVDKTTEVGKADTAGVSDVLVESAISTILDFEDSVAAVDADDKVEAYRNWRGLMVGDLESKFMKGEKEVTRTLNANKTFVGPAGESLEIRSRSLLLVRNVGHLMTTPSVLDKSGNEIGEGLLDAVMSVALAKFDLEKEARLAKNSPENSVYIVKPKMHGPEEVKIACETFDIVERHFGLPSNTVKLGIMDEERRTSTNLKACIAAASSRVAFINTGFLDRTGDEIHTSMEAGPFVRKKNMKAQPWITAYENRNVDIGLACGFTGKAQIGKGMWAMPDLLGKMLEEKIGHPRAGANCAWVPSPTAATLHATHYHRVDALKRQGEIAEGGNRSTLQQLLTIPVIEDPSVWTAEEKIEEIENSAQGILGYAVRWVDQGIGCSKVPDINNVGLMEDRATCRISSQLLANWLHHKVVTEEEVLTAMKKMAEVVDRQNAGDDKYEPLAPSFDGIAWRAACDLALKGRTQPSGYTEPILHLARLEKKQQQSLKLK
ncbi:hypothetical protein TL16_g06189 [Triparma laevis f. inornata]|uniref:Malate synthase n=1 Tax=Triparma laevis f. inornata TaxID=1714386 RepID=A0A9W7E9P0_9STRA|nr:hypothetical protein TL16_g06189 [Triparma laevis f. inornata]